MRVLPLLQRLDRVILLAKLGMTITQAARLDHSEDG